MSVADSRLYDLLNRGVENIFPNKDFLEKRLASKEPLTLYAGYDPTAPTLHIGHGITMLKLSQFQELGHKVIILIGDFTAMIGDPTDKTSARQKLTREQVLENCKNYQKQAAAILNFGGDNPAQIKFNSDWLAKMSFADVIELASHFTVQQMLERDMFQKRLSKVLLCPECSFEEVLGEKIFFQTQALRMAILDSGKNKLSEEDRDEALKTWECKKCKTVFPIKLSSSPIYLHEFLYPLMQGYDSVAMDVDGEVGGNDQTFNMLAGRDLMKDLKHKEKFVVATKLLTDDKGKKMGKTEGNMVALSDTPEEMFGKVMSWTDGMIDSGFNLCTRLSAEEVKNIKQELTNPRDQKMRLAYEITKVFLGEESAKKGQNYFVSTFSKKEMPDIIPELKPSALDIVTVLVEAKFVKSKSEARQVLDQGGVKINEKKVESIGDLVKPGDIVQKGSRYFVKIV